MLEGYNMKPYTHLRGWILIFLSAIYPLIKISTAETQKLFHSLFGPFQNKRVFQIQHCCPQPQRSISYIFWPNHPTVTWEYAQSAS